MFQDYSYRDYGIHAVPIHDCLIVAARHREVAKQVIERATEEVLGFVPVVKVTGDSSFKPKYSTRRSASGRREGRWDDAAEYKGATIEELRGEGLKRAKAQNEAWKRMIEKYPPLEFGDDVAVPTDL